MRLNVGILEDAHSAEMSLMFILGVTVGVAFPLLLLAAG
jgi:hypothetical protein